MASGGDFPTGYDDNDGVVAALTHRQDSPPTPGPLPHLTLRRPTRRRRWRQLELRRRRAGARVRFARSLAASLLAVARRCRQTSWLGSERSGDKNRWNEDDLKFRSRTISRNNITLRDEHERVRRICHCPSSTYSSIVGNEDNLGISHVKTSYGFAEGACSRSH